MDKTIYYYCKDELKKKAIISICDKMDVGGVELKQNQLDLSIAEVTGKVFPKEFNKAKLLKAPAFYAMPEMIIFDGIIDKDLDRFLFEYRQSGAKPVRLKAIVTPFNLLLSLYGLICELDKEAGSFEQ